MKEQDGIVEAEGRCGDSCGSRPSLMNGNSSRSLALLVLIAWIAHFFYFRSLGLYEDDYAFIPGAMSSDLPTLLKTLRDCFAAWPQGRPLGFFLPPLFTFVGNRLGGLQGVYLIGFTIVTANTFLCYAVLKRICPRSEMFALTGALAFCLFPPDTTKTLLTHSLILQPSLTFLLLASLCYLSGRRPISYLFILGSLISYESPFMVFLGVPLLKDKWDRRLIREIVQHAVILCTMILCATIVRKLTGDSRLAMGDSIPVLSVKVFASILIGPAVSILLFFRAPLVTVLHLRMGIVAILAFCLTAFLWVFYKLKTVSDGERIGCPISIHLNSFSLTQDRQTGAYYLRIGRHFLAATAMLCLAYVISFTHFPPIARYGRGTSVHLAATFGGSIIFACVCHVVLLAASSRDRQNRARHSHRGLVPSSLVARARSYHGAVTILACYLSLLVGYHFLVQRDFVRSWQNQRSFWTSVLEECQDMADGTVIFVIRDNLPSTKYIQTNSWADPIILEQLYRIPEQWKIPPRLFVVGRDWADKVVLEKDQFKWKVPTATWESHWGVLPDSNVILLEMVDNRLTRRYGAVAIQGSELTFKKEQPPVVSSLEGKVLFGYLINKKTSSVGSRQL